MRSGGDFNLRISGTLAEECIDSRQAMICVLWGSKYRSSSNVRSALLNKVQEEGIRSNVAHDQHRNCISQRGLVYTASNRAQHYSNVPASACGGNNIGYVRLEMR